MKKDEKTSDDELRTFFHNMRSSLVSLEMAHEMMEKLIRESLKSSEFASDVSEVRKILGLAMSITHKLQSNLDSITEMG